MNKKPLTLEDKYILTEKLLKRMGHSSKPLHQAIVEIFKGLPSKRDNGDLNAEVVNTKYKYLKIVNSLSKLSRKWAINIHHLFEVVNPKITDVANPKYSPIYTKYQCPLPPDRFGELSKKDFVLDSQDPNGQLVPHANKLVGDRRFTKCNDFGSAWNDAGEVVHVDEDGHPVLDGFAKWVADKITVLEQQSIANRKRDRHFAAFMIAHTRDVEDNERTSEPLHKESHFHIVLDLPVMKSRYQIMESLGFNFDDFVETFNWIKEYSQTQDELLKRTNAFFDTLIGSLNNYDIPAHYQAALQYLIHQSKKAIESQKTPYSTKEVISWLPDNPGESYESIAGVNDSQRVSQSVADEINVILHSKYNQVHHTLERYVGKNKIFSRYQLEQIHKLGKKQVGEDIFSAKSRRLIRNQIISWIREKKMEFNDWPILIHASFSDSDADELMNNKDFIEKLNSTLDNEKTAIMSDPSASRNMMTIAIFAKTGGIGKTRLANAMALLMDKNRKAFQVVTKNKNITFDPFQDYEAESSAVMDELSPSVISWAQLKDLLDPHKISYVGSRFHNKSPWNLKQIFITNVFANGISDYTNGVLHYAEGVSSLGYLEKSGHDWNLITGKVDAGEAYVAQLSQLLRRIPYVITLAPTENNLGTVITVSTINFQPGGQKVSHYDYVHTANSIHIFHQLINDGLSNDDVEKIAATVIQMLRQLKEDADKSFKQNPGKLLDEVDGFIPEHHDFKVRYQNSGQPYLVNDNNSEISTASKSQAADMFGNDNNNDNLITRLQKIEVLLWPKVSVEKANVNPNLNQLDAFLKGYEVPVEKTGYDEIKTIKLSENGQNMLKNNPNNFWILMNSIKDINSNQKDGLFTLQSNKYIATFKIK